jgi:hypothetical protein
MATTKPEVTSERGTYGKPRKRTSTATKAAIIGIGAIGILLTPVIAILGGVALASAVGGRGRSDDQVRKR